MLCDFFLNVELRLLVLATTDLLSSWLKHGPSTGIPIILNLYLRPLKYSQKPTTFTVVGKIKNTPVVQPSWAPLKTYIHWPIICHIPSGCHIQCATPHIGYHFHLKPTTPSKMCWKKQTTHTSNPVDLVEEDPFESPSLLTSGSAFMRSPQDLHPLDISMLHATLLFSQKGTTHIPPSLLASVDVGVVEGFCIKHTLPFLLKHWWYPCSPTYTDLQPSQVVLPSSLSPLDTCSCSNKIKFVSPFKWWILTPILFYR